MLTGVHFVLIAVVFGIFIPGTPKIGGGHIEKCVGSFVIFDDFVGGLMFDAKNGNEYVETGKQILMRLPR